MKRRAFTLVELLVVIAIIGLLSTVAILSLKSSNVNARNQQRKANLIQLSKVLELYFNDNGVYPSTESVWWGTCSNYHSKPDSGADAWIPNVSPAYIATLPHDPNTSKLNLESAQLVCRSSPDGNCYIYKSDGTNYKLLAHCTPEGVMSANDFFYDTTRATWAWAVSTDGARSW